MPIRINYVLDEFSSLPKISDFPAMISAARSRNIRFNLIIQSKHQLMERYGNEAETIQSNCINWIFLTSRELPLLEYISALCGNRISGTKPLLTVSELQRFNKNEGEVLILSGRKRPFKGNLPDISKYDYDDFERHEYPFQDFTSDVSLQNELIVKIDSLFEYKLFNEPQKMESYIETNNDNYQNILNEEKKCDVEENISINSNDIDMYDVSKDSDKNVLDDNIMKQVKDFFQNEIYTKEITPTKCEISFPMYKIDGEKYKIYLISECGKFYLSDNGVTYSELDSIFELKEPDVIKNITAVLNQYKCRKHENSNAFIIECTCQDITLKLGYLIQALSFMLNMKIFYV
jgi:hypothetical protein